MKIVPSFLLWIQFRVDPNNDAKLTPTIFSGVVLKDPCLTNTCVRIFNRNFLIILELQQGPKLRIKGANSPIVYCPTLPNFNLF